MTPMMRLEQRYLVRLTTFEPTIPLEDADFIQAWREAAETTQPPGLVYRELCRKLPEAAKTATPIPFPFLEYAVLLPEQDERKPPPLPEVFTESVGAAAALYHAKFRFVENALTESTPKYVAYDLYELSGPAGLQQGFVMSWPPRGACKSREPGFVAATLQVSLRGREPVRFGAFDRTEWQSADLFRAGTKHLTEAFPVNQRQAAMVKARSGLFEVAASVQPRRDTNGAEPHRINSDSATQMKAVRIHAYGGPDALRLETVPRPEPGPGELQVRVRAAAINPLDVPMRSGGVERVFPPWFPDILGFSASGVVEAVGHGVNAERIGEEVYSVLEPTMRGGYAQFLVGPADFFYPKPRNLGWAVAAATPPVFAVVYSALFGRAKIQTGQRVLIHGGAGVVGRCAVQLAKQAGAYVIATASGKNLSAVKALGADEVVDYQTQKFEDRAQNVDFILDTQAGETRERSWALLKKGGTLVTLLPFLPGEDKARDFGVNAFMVYGHPNVAEIMAEMTQRLEGGLLQPPEIAEVFPLEQAAQAHALYEAGSIRGRIVLKVEQD